MIRFVVYRGRDGKFYWHARSANGRTIADGSQGYTTRGAARRALKRFQDEMVSHNFVTVQR